jgi:prepilin-type N-terminal cleavage/methylation domain-containing protein
MTEEVAHVMGRRRRSESGFTIIELLMVIALLAVVAAIAIPKLNYSAYRINAGVRGLTALLARAQRLAVTDQANVNVIFNVATNAVMLHEDANNNNAIDSGERVRTYPLGEGVAYGLGGAPVRIYSPAPLTFTHALNSMPEIIFRRDGSASENGAIYLTSTAALNAARPTDARDVEVIEATGRAEWYQYTGTAWVRKF